MTPEDARRIAASLPGVEDASSDGALNFVKDGKAFAWSWMQRAHPKTPRVPNLGVVAVRVRPEFTDILLDAHPDWFVDDPHYRGYPAVLLRLDAVDEDGLRALREEGAAHGERGRRGRPASK
jgi:hypothetical protein